MQDLDKRVSEDLEQLKNVNYAINLNTGKINNNVLQNIIYNPLNNDLPSEKDLIFANMSLTRYLTTIKTYKGKKYNNLKELQEDIKSFNSAFDINLSNINKLTKDFLDNNVKDTYISVCSTLQAQEQVKIIDAELKDLKEFSNIDINNPNFKITTKTEILREAQEQFKDRLIKELAELNKANPQLAENNKVYAILLSAITRATEEHKEQELNNYIKANKDKLTEIHNNFIIVNDLVIEAVNDFKSALKRLDKNYIDTDLQVVNTPKLKEPTNTELSLLAYNLMNGITYFEKNYTTIRFGKYEFKLRCHFDKDNNLIITDNNNNSITLYPVDYMLFTAFTNINNFNGGNVAITIQEALRLFLGDKDLRLTDKQNEKYAKRLRDYELFKLSGFIYNTNNNKDLLFEIKDPISILSNQRVYDNNKGEGYIIGQSAIITIIKKYFETTGIDYRATYTNAHKYFNDGQKNTIEIINLKTYLLPKCLQRVNAKERLNKYQHLINLTDLYKMQADLKGLTNKELNKTQKSRTRIYISRFLNHLIDKKLIDSFIFCNKEGKPTPTNYTHIAIYINEPTLRLTDKQN